MELAAFVLHGFRTFVFICSLFVPSKSLSTYETHKFNLLPKYSIYHILYCMHSIASCIPKFIYDTSFIAPETLSLINEIHNSSLIPRIPASFRVLVPVLYLFEVNCRVAPVRLINLP
jgi:hypothetical protein